MTPLSRLTDNDDPGPLLARLRAEGPLARVRVPLVGPVWATTTDAAARALLKDTDRFARDPTAATGKSFVQSYWWLPRRIAPLMDSLITKDGDDHRRLRRLVDRAFAKTAIEDLRPAIAARADALLDAVGPDPVDLVRAYTRPLPFDVICDLLGLPEEALPALRHSIAPVSSVAGPISAVFAMARLGGAIRLLRETFAEARRAPRPGLIAALVEEDMTEDELVSMVFTLFVAGHETTVHLLNACLLTLCDRPDLRPTMADAPARTLFVEEVMRAFTPVAITKMHYARADCDFEGVALKKGDVLSALLVSANHDPARFETPGSLVPDRRPNAHLGFGHGPHVCLGMQLARAEAEVGIARLLARFPDYTLDGPRPGWARRVGIRAPASLRVRLRA